MVPEVQGSEPQDAARCGLSARDLFMVRTMLRVNASWVVTCHNAHIVKIEPVAKPLHADSVPLWWIRYAEANRLDLNL